MYEIMTKNQYVQNGLFGNDWRVASLSIEYQTAK